MSLAFEPRPLRPPGRRAPDRAVLILLAGVLFVGLSITKPWQASPEPAPVAAMPSAVPSEPPPTPPPLISLRAAAVAAVARGHDEWGLRMITMDRGVGLTITWLPVAPTVAQQAWDTYGPGAPGVFSVLDRSPVVALGVTTPAASTPLAVRAWQVYAGGSARLLPLAGIIDPDGDQANPPGLELFGAPASTAPADGSDIAIWGPGVYRFDMLVGDSVRSIAVRLPDESSSSPPDPLPVDIAPDAAERATREAAALAVTQPTLAWVASDLSPRTPASVSLPSGPLEAAGAWSAEAQPPAAWWSDEQPPAVVVQAPLRADVLALGAILPSGSVIAGARLTQLSPSRFVWFDVAPRSPFRLTPPPNAKFFFEPESIPYPDGTYRLDVTWSGGGSRHETSLYARLTGGMAPPGPTGWQLAAARYASYAGRWGLMVGTAPPASGGPAWSQIRQLVPPPDAPPSAASTTSQGTLGPNCLDGPLAGPNERIIGLTSPGGHTPASVRVDREYEGGQVVPFPVALAPTVEPGLTLLAPAGGGTWPVGVYAISIASILTGDGPQVTRIMPLCVGVTAGGPARLVVPEVAYDERAYEIAVAASWDVPFDVARAATLQSGRWGLAFAGVTGSPVPRDPAAAGILPIWSTWSPVDPAGAGSVSCAERTAPAAIAPQVVGLTYPGHQVLHWSVAREPGSSAGGAPATRSSASPDPGLAELAALDVTVVTPPGATGVLAIAMSGGGAWQAGAYRFTVSFASRTYELPFCVGG
jgi:hypothetical protein